METGSTLIHVWFGILAVILYFYLITDGFDFGVGMLVLLHGNETDRGVMVHSIESVWHANQTWLVIAGGVLFGAFPAVYGSVLSALYVPLAVMLFALMVRGVALEYRAEATNKALVSVLFALGSLVSAFAQGVMLGGVLQGIPLENGDFAGSVMAWLRPFPVVLGLAVCAADIMLGGCWLVMKTEGKLQRKAQQWGKLGVILTGLLLVGVIAAVLLDPNPGLLREGLFGALPLILLGLGMVALGLVLPNLDSDSGLRAFGLASASVLSLMLAFAAAIYPTIVPPGLTLQQAASPDNMLAIMLYVIGALLPVLIIYNGYQYRVFGGKSKPEAE